jgi:outer membrane cobalamin receptor
MIRFPLLLFAAAAVALNAAEVRGVVVDPSSRPVPNATVECGGGQTTTDAEGRFALDRTGPCTASVRRAGFETAIVAIEPGKEIRVLLTIASLNDRVVVSATRTPTTIEESGVAASVFTSRDLVERQSPPVADLLRDVPGVAIATSGRRGAITSIFTRGGQSTSTLFLLDGVPLNEPGGQIDIVNFPTAGLDRVEVVRGAESALFGAEAAAGVVQLFSSRGDPEARIPHGSLSYERGNFQTDHWTANLNGGFADRIDYSLTADQFHTVGMFPNDFFRDTSGTANIGFRISSATQLRAVYRELDAITGNPGQVGFGAFNSNAYGGDRESTLSVRLDDVRGSHFVQRVTFGYNRLRNLFEDAGTDAPYDIAAVVHPVTEPTPRVYLVRLVPPGSLAPADLQPGLQYVQTTVYDFPSTFTDESHRTSADYQGAWTHRGGELVFGYRFERQAGVISGSDVDRLNNGVFVHEQYTIGRRVFLTGGARIEHSTTFGSRFVPRGSATWQAFSSTFLRVSAGRGFTEPSLLENFAKESYYVGNPNLKPEKTTMFDAGIVQELFNRRVRLEATWFRNSFRDLIVFDSTNFPSTWSNIDRSWARGLETSATIQIAKYVRLSANYTKLYTKITSTNSTNPYTGVGQELPRRPKDSGSAWISVTPRRWSLMVGGRGVGERQDSDYLFGVTRNPGYGTMFVNGSYNLTRHVTPYARIDNLLDEPYEEVLGYTALSRSVMGGIRVAW